VTALKKILVAEGTHCDLQARSLFLLKKPGFPIPASFFLRKNAFDFKKPKDVNFPKISVLKMG